MASKATLRKLTEQAKELLALGRAGVDLERIKEAANAFEEALDEVGVDDEDLELTERELEELNDLLLDAIANILFHDGPEDTIGVDKELGTDEPEEDDYAPATVLPPPPTAEELAAAAAAKKARKQAQYGRR